MFNGDVGEDFSMKNYKFIVPIVLVGLFALSIYMLYDTKSSQVERYNQSLRLAREAREMDVQVDAEKYYKEALAQTASPELYVEIGEFYAESGQTKKAINWGAEMLIKYPTDISGYEYMFDIHSGRKDYISCFQLAETMRKRELVSEKVNEILAEIEYEYFFNCEYADVGIFAGGVCPVKLEDKWGYVNAIGDKVIPNKFLKVGYHSGELAPVIDRDKDVYYIDLQGNKKLVPQDIGTMKELGLIENGMFSMFNGKTWGFYNTDGQHVFGEYKEASSIGNGVAAVTTDGEKWLLVDRTGTDLTQKTYDGVAMDEKQVIYRNDRIFVCEDYYYKMVDLAGNYITDTKYEDVRIFNDGTYAAVKMDGLWGFIDKDGNVIIEPKYENARSFTNGLAAVQYAGKWGFIDATGKLVIETQFDDARDFTSQGSAFVQTDGAWKLLRLYKYNY